MSLVENINKRKKAGTSRSKKDSTVSPEAYAEMKAGYRDGGMAGQMSKQMGISKREAGGLMAKAKKMNKEQGYNMGGPVDTFPGMGAFKYGGEMNLKVRMYNITSGDEDVPMEWGREHLDRDSEELIKGTQSQVRGRYFNNNNGKGTF